MSHRIYPVSLTLKANSTSFDFSTKENMGGNLEIILEYVKNF